MDATTKRGIYRVHGVGGTDCYRFSVALGDLLFETGEDDLADSISAHGLQTVDPASEAIRLARKTISYPSAAAALAAAQDCEDSIPYAQRERLVALLAAARAGAKREEEEEDILRDGGVR